MNLLLVAKHTCIFVQELIHFCPVIMFVRDKVHYFVIYCINVLFCRS